MSFLRAETVTRIDDVAAQEVGRRHPPFAGRLEFEDFDQTVTGRDQKAPIFEDWRAGSVSDRCY
jgi:hypothetical protein